VREPEVFVRAERVNVEIVEREEALLPAAREWLEKV